MIVVEVREYLHEVLDQVSTPELFNDEYITELINQQSGFCQWCNQFFTQQSNLDHHQSIHRELDDINGTDARSIPGRFENNEQTQNNYVPSQNVNNMSTNENHRLQT